MFFAKAAIDDELTRLDALLSRQESRVRAAFAGFVRDVKDEAVIRQAADFLAKGDVNGALDVVNSHVVRLASILPSVFQQAASTELVSTAAQLAPIVPTVSVSFDPTDPRAAMAMRDSTLEFISSFTEKQVAATRQALTSALETGKGTQATVQAFKDSLGLTPKMEAAVANYRSLLQEGSAEALNRALRDRRYDPSVERAASGGEPISNDQINVMVDRYRQRYLAYRGESIARTETGRAVSVAREEAFRQNIAAAEIPAAACDQTWLTTLDGRERFTHRTMNGQTVPLGSSFISPSGAHLRYPCDPLAPAAEVVQCRCHRSFKIAPDRIP